MPTQFRSIEEFKRFLSTLEKEIDTGIKEALETSKKLAASFEFILDETPAPKRAKTTKTDFPVVSVPNKDKLTKNYALAERLERQYQSLLQTEADMLTTFPAAKNANAKGVMRHIAELKADLEVAMRKLFEALNSVAENHAPKEFKKFMTTLASGVSEHIDYDDLSTVMYAAMTKDDELIFTGYLIITNALSDEGTTAPNLYIAVAWTVNGTIKIFVDHEFLMPTNLKHGVVIKDSKGALASVQRQLALEGFSSAIGSIPAEVRLRTTVDDLHRGLSMKTSVKSIKSQDGSLVFVVSDLSVANQLYQELKASVSRGTQIRMRTKKSGAGGEIIFTFTDRNKDSTVSVQDLEFLQTTYNLTQQQLRRIANEISG